MLLGEWTTEDNEEDNENSSDVDVVPELDPRIHAIR